MRGTVGFFYDTQTVWHDFSDVESILVLSQSPIWHSWFRNSGSILCLSLPSLWHPELLDTKFWHAVRRFFTGIQKTFVVVENWNQLCKDWWCNAHSSVFFLISFGTDGFVFRSYSCRHHADETLGIVWKNSYQSSASVVTAGCEGDGWKWSNTDLYWSFVPQQRWNCTTRWQSAGGRRQQLMLYSPLKWNINI